MTDEEKEMAFLEYMRHGSNHQSMTKIIEEKAALTSLELKSTKKVSEKDPKPKQNAKIETTKANKRYEDEDDDIIILDHDEFKDDITTPEQITIHVNCYVTQDILAKPDQSTHTKITPLVTEGDSTSYLQGTFYADLTSKARQAILQSIFLQSLQKDGGATQTTWPTCPCQNNSTHAAKATSCSQFISQ